MADTGNTGNTGNQESENLPADPNCDNCGAAEQGAFGFDGQNLCNKCFNKITRDQGLRNHETQEWSDRLDRIIAGTATDDEKKAYGIPLL